MTDHREAGDDHIVSDQQVPANGARAADLAALEELLLRISTLVEEVPEIVELDLNPVMALRPGAGCRIVDARIRVAPFAD